MNVKYVGYECKNEIQSIIIDHVLEYRFHRYSSYMITQYFIIYLVEKLTKNTTYHKSEVI